MEMTGSRALPMSQQIVWDALNNAEILKACIPGCEKFELTEPNTYAVGTAIKIGPVAARFNGRVTLTDIVAPTSYQLQFDAAGRIYGFGVDGVVRLSANASAAVSVPAPENAPSTLSQVAGSMILASSRR